MTDRQETIADIIAEMKREAAKIFPALPIAVLQLATRIEAAHKREHELTKPAKNVNSCAASDMAGNCGNAANDDTALVKNCATCKHYCRNMKYCPTQDTVNTNPDILPIFRMGPCDKWMCKHTSERHPWMSWEKCVAEYQKSKEAGEYGPY